jgi:hypothetical protein
MNTVISYIVVARTYEPVTKLDLPSLKHYSVLMFDRLEHYVPHYEYYNAPRADAVLPYTQPVTPAPIQQTSIQQHPNEQDFEHAHHSIPKNCRSKRVFPSHHFTLLPPACTSSSELACQAITVPWRQSVYPNASIDELHGTGPVTHGPQPSRDTSLNDPSPLTLDQNVRF